MFDMCVIKIIRRSAISDQIPFVWGPSSNQECHESNAWMHIVSVTSGDFFCVV